MSMNINPEPIYKGALALLSRKGGRMSLNGNQLGDVEYDVGFLTVGLTQMNAVGSGQRERWRVSVRLDDGRIFTLFRNEAEFVQWDFEREDDRFDCYTTDAMRPRDVVIRYKGLPDAEAYAEMRLAL